MGKVGTGCNLQFDDTLLNDKLAYEGPQQITYKASIPHDGVVLIAASTATNVDGANGAAGVWVTKNGATVAWNKIGTLPHSGEQGMGSSVSANLAVKAGDEISITIRNTSTQSDAYLSVLSTAGKLEFTKL